jgi:hypothetical protein
MQGENIQAIVDLYGIDAILKVLIKNEENKMCAWKNIDVPEIKS